MHACYLFKMYIANTTIQMSIALVGMPMNSLLPLQRAFITLMEILKILRIFCIYITKVTSKLKETL